MAHIHGLDGGQYILPNGTDQDTVLPQMTSRLFCSRHEALQKKAMFTPE